MEEPRCLSFGRGFRPVSSEIQELKRVTQLLSNRRRWLGIDVTSFNIERVMGLLSIVAQLLNEDGRLLTYPEFLERFQFPVTPKEYAIVFDAIPEGVVCLLKASQSVNRTDVLLGPTTDLFLDGVEIKDKKCNNTHIRNLCKPHLIPSCLSFWNAMFENINWKLVWTIPDRFCITNKVKEISFKIIHKFYPVKLVLFKFKHEQDDLCVFCRAEKESLVHLFVRCRFVKLFWTDLQSFVCRKLKVFFRLKDFDILLYCLVENLEKEHLFIVNLLIILGKFHIHKSKWSNNTPLFSSFEVELKHYLNSIKNVRNNKARKTYDICKKYKLII